MTIGPNDPLNDQPSDRHESIDLDALLSAAMAEAAPPLPALGNNLRTAVANAPSASLRRPMSRFIMLSLASIAWAVGFAALSGFRRDAGELPQLWLGSYLVAWTVGFALLSFAIQVPRRGDIMPRSALAARIAIVLTALSVAAGLFLARGAPGLSTTYEPTLSNIIHYAPYCLRMGLFTAALPLVGAAFLLRGTLWSGEKMAGLTIGAASGSLGGLMLHLHCPIVEATHLGFIHAGVVVTAAAAGTLLVPIIVRIR